MAQRLGADILNGRYKAGFKLPREAGLLERFGVSRTILREALKTLAAKGLLVSKTKVGTTVRPSENWNYFDPDVLAWKVGDGVELAFLNNLAEVRRAIEPAAAALAARRRTRGDIAQLRNCIAAMDRNGHSSLSFAEADLNFHTAIGTASGNPLFRSIASVIEAALAAQFAISAPMSSRAFHRHVVRSHAAILQAIEARDAEAAASAMMIVIELGVTRAKRARRNTRRA